MLKVLVHEAQVQVQSSYIRVALSRRDLQDGECAIHVLECTAEVAARVMVEGKVRISVGCLRMVSAENALLEDNALSLELYGLKEVSELELD